MEALECSSYNDSIPLYESYMRSFNIVENCDGNDLTLVRPASADYQDLVCSNNSRDDWLGPELSFSKQLLQPTLSENKCEFLGVKPGSRPPSVLMDSTSIAGSATEESNLSEATPVTSEDSKSQHSKYPKPVVITSLITMENSNNAVDSVPLFTNAKTDNLFKLPISELSFNGTIKNIQKLKPIVDPMAAMTLAHMNVACEESSGEKSEQKSFNCVEVENSVHKECGQAENSNLDVNRLDESTGDSQYAKDIKEANEYDKAKWLLEQSSSSLEASFDSGVRSPDMFSDNEDGMSPKKNPDHFQRQNNLEAYDKQQMTKLEAILQGVLPPPSVTTIKADVAEMLKKYYCFLPAFTGEGTSDPSVTTKTPTKLTSYVNIPTDTCLPSEMQETAELACNKSEEESNNVDIIIDNKNSIEMKPKTIHSDSSSCGSKNSSFAEKKMTLTLSSEVEAKETAWPAILKCRFYDVYYNCTKYSERIELLALKYGERYVGAETAASTGPGAPATPGSATKRKMMRLKMAQAKSPGRRLSHLARRRQAFCSAATINEKALASTSKMVLIDKNFFPHRKLITSADRASPRLRRTPGKRTPGKRTPGQTPRSGGSSRKKAMRRLLMDPEQLTRSQPAQPSRETSRRALFVSPEQRAAPPAASTSVPPQAMKSKRALFSSPDRQAETKSMDGSVGDQLLKRKRDTADADDSRSKIAKSLSFGGDSIGGSQRQAVSRRASEMFTAKSNMAELDEQHRKKLLWAVSEALRLHGWRMQSPGFRDKASQLARLTRRLLLLPPHAARLASPQLSTSETLFKIARQHVFAIIQGRSVDECFREERERLQREAAQRPSGYVSAAAYAQLRDAREERVKENTCHGIKPDQPKSNSKNILQDKLLNVDDSSGLSLLDNKGLYKSNSMPTFEEAAKMRARRQISFDNVDFPKR